MNSTHKVEVFKIGEITLHPNADRLEIIKVFDHYYCIVRKGEFKTGDLACYVPPDNIMPDREEYAFLKGRLRIKSQKLRGFVSQGLVLPAPHGTQEGDDVTKILGVTPYIKTTPRLAGGSKTGKYSAAKAPTISYLDYDLDSWYRYGSHFEEGEHVVVTEKIHGANMKVTYQDKKFHVGSRHFWRKDQSDDLYWHALHKNKWLKKLAKGLPNHTIIGELYGRVQNLTYGLPTTVDFRVFDIRKPDGTYIDAKNLAAVVVDIVNQNTGTLKERVVRWLDKLFDIPLRIHLSSEMLVPVLYSGPYDTDRIKSLISGESYLAMIRQEREGIVIKTGTEHSVPRIGRLALKAVSPDFQD